MNETPMWCSAVPEPSAFGMVLIGAPGLVGFRGLGFRRAA
jgi:PEP-CTERM motif